MRRTILSAALVLAGTAVLPSAAGAGTATIVVIDGQCDIFNVGWERGVATINEDASGCGTKYGIGVIGLSHAGRLGHAMIFALHDAASPRQQYLLQFSYPLGIGTWSAYVSDDGATYRSVGGGTYHTTK